MNTGKSDSDYSAVDEVERAGFVARCEVSFVKVRCNHRQDSATLLAGPDCGKVKRSEIVRTVIVFIVPIYCARRRPASDARTILGSVVAVVVTVTVQYER